MRASLSLALVAALLAAGCVGLGGKAPPAAPPSTPANDTNASRLAMPDGRDGSFAAFNETNRTEAGAGGVEHRHDYWGGKERVTIAQGNFGLAGAFPPTAGGASGLIRLPTQALVFEGTGAIEVTLSNPQRRACGPLYTVDEEGNMTRVCTDYRTGTRAPDAAGAKLHLWYRDGIAKDWIDAGEAAWGKPLTIQVKDPKQTDMPHATSSLWRFLARSADAQDDTLTFDAKVDIIRAAGSIPLWPGHPNFYADAHARVVLQKHVTTKESGAPSIVDGSFSPLEYVAPDKLVSYGTRTLAVFVNNTKVTSASTPATTPQSWYVEYYNATGIVKGTPEANNATMSWTLKVGDAGMDSPYAQASRWGFLLRGIFADCTGCIPYTAEYDLAIVASDAVLADDAYQATA